MIRVSMSLVLWLGCATCAIGADVFVDIYRGDDLTGNGTAAAPYRTLTTALLFAQGGDVVIALPGIYSVQNGEQYPLMVPPGVDLRGRDGAVNTILDGATVSWPSQSAMVLLQGDSIVSGFTLRDGPTANWWDAAIANWGAAAVTIHDNVFEGPNQNRAVVLYDLAADPTSTSSAEIVNNVCHSIGPADALLVFDYPSVLIAHNTIVDGARSGAAVKEINSVVSGTITNNHFGNLGWFPLELGAAGIHVVHNNFHLNPTGSITGVFGSETGSLFVTPAFASSLQHDYRLQPASLLIDAGAPIGWTFDFEGDPRTVGPATDIGVDESLLPSTGLRAPFVPGQTTAIDTFGAPGATYAQLLGVFPGTFLTPLGTLHFDPVVTIILGVGTLPPSGVAVTSIPVPAVPASVLGIPMIVQSVVGIGPGALSGPRVLSLVQ